METPSPGPDSQVRIALAGPEQRDLIYRARHSIYGLELGQHPANPSGRLTDALDEFNIYMVAQQGDELLAFISITPPGPKYSIDKYFERSQVPVEFDARLFEIRLLTVLSNHRGTLLAAAMMYAALRYIEEHGGTRIVGIGRREVLDLYLRFGLRGTGMQTQSGKVLYELMTASVKDVSREVESYPEVLRRIETQCDWQLPFAFRAPASCQHGGAFWDAVGDDFATLERLEEVVSADVLDAWFPPAPEVLWAIEGNLAALIKTSPPTHAAGLVRCISRVRGIPTASVLPAAGSSELIYLAFPRWLTRQSQVLVLDPSYGEYQHLLETVIGCEVDGLPLRREEGYVLNPAALAERMASGYDLVVLVNPNSPTGTMIGGRELQMVLAGAPQNTRVWIDETYIEHAGAEHSLERYAANTKNVFVCKSMSKGYALSGIRVAYLVGDATELSALRAFAPPWSVSLPAQVSAVAALEASEYYQARYRETTELREELAKALCDRFGFEVVPSKTNFLMCHVPESLPTAAEICEQTRKLGVYFRDAGTISQSLGPRVLRIAVKDGLRNDRIVQALATVLERKATSAA
jgi:histidinol-phosphate/aromatic aminotransferase/cobyric acid decarboxylase-like protein/GNAT superfamily N-acetyltransferase